MKRNELQKIIDAPLKIQEIPKQQPKGFYCNFVIIRYNFTASLYPCHNQLWLPTENPRNDAYYWKSKKLHSAAPHRKSKKFQNSNQRFLRTFVVSATPKKIPFSPPLPVTRTESVAWQNDIRKKNDPNSRNFKTLTWKETSYKKSSTPHWKSKKFQNSNQKAFTVTLL